MAKQPQDAKRVKFTVSTAQRPDFKHSLAAYVFDARGQLVHHAEVRDGRLELPLSDAMVRERVFIAPVDPTADAKSLTAAQLQRLGAYEPVLLANGKLIDRIDIPGSLIDFWPFCFCWVHGKVVRAADNRAVCNARVHICEVDRIPIWILKLPDRDIFRLRDDLLEVLRNPPIPPIPPERVPRFPPVPPGPGPDPAPWLAARPALRFNDAVSRVALNPQPLPPGKSLLRESIALEPHVYAKLRSTSVAVVRNALADQWQLILPWLCYWPHWWWWFRCDEIRTVTTDSHGRFETLIFYPCNGDHPDLYFWVEYDFGSGFETVYRPRIACHTYWNYVCGSEVTIRVTDPRVPGCEEEPDLPGVQVVVNSIGVGIAVRQVQTAGHEGLTTGGQPFGATLEPRVDFSRDALINTKNVPYYRWSYRRLTGTDGISNTVATGTPAINAWSIMTKDVVRHYKDGTAYPADLMGPMPTTGPGAAPAPNLFRIRPVNSPSGDEWIVLNEHVDLATAYFETDSLGGSPTVIDPPPLTGPRFTDDLAAGLYELKLELFDNLGNLVNWTAKGIDLRITDQDAPFGTGTVTTSPAPDYNRVLAGGNTMGFRMVVRVDNNRCSADINPVGGSVTPDPDCGFHRYTLPASATLSFDARHPNNFATYGFATARGSGPNIADATTSGTVGLGGNNGFGLSGSFTYAKGVDVATLLDTCPNAAFSERLDVYAMATNGYSTLSGYNAADNAAFALAQPCPACECEEEDDE